MNEVVNHLEWKRHCAITKNVQRYFKYLWLLQGWVFPVQNLFFPSKMGKTGINLFFPVFPVHNWEKLSKTGKNYAGLYFRPAKCSKNVMHYIYIYKYIQQDRLGAHFIHTVVMIYELIIQILWTEIFAVILNLIIQFVLTFTHNTITLLPNHVQNCDLIFKYQ